MGIDKIQILSFDFERIKRLNMLDLAFQIAYHDNELNFLSEEKVLKSILGKYSDEETGVDPDEFNLKKIYLIARSFFEGARASHRKDRHLALAANFAFVNILLLIFLAIKYKRKEEWSEQEAFRAAIRNFLSDLQVLIFTISSNSGYMQDLDLILDALNRINVKNSDVLIIVSSYFNSLSSLELLEAIKEMHDLKVQIPKAVNSSDSEDSAEIISLPQQKKSKATKILNFPTEKTLDTQERKQNLLYLLEQIENDPKIKNSKSPQADNVKRIIAAIRSIITSKKEEATEDLLLNPNQGLLSALRNALNVFGIEIASSYSVD